MTYEERIEVLKDTAMRKARSVSNMKIELDRSELTLLLTALSVISECAKIDGERCTAIECLRSTIKEQIDDGGDIRNARD